MITTKKGWGESGDTPDVEEDEVSTLESLTKPMILYLIMTRKQEMLKVSLS